MEVLLVKNQKSAFKLNEDACKEFDFKDLMYILGAEYKPTVDNAQRYAAFRTREDLLAQMNDYDIDTDKKVILANNGCFFLPLKNVVTISESKETVSNESTDTKEDKAE